MSKNVNTLEMKYLECTSKCCKLVYNSYEPISHPFITVKRSRRKAGIFLTDPNGKILLIQSKGNLWGCPKGTMKSNETNKECAIREVKEETGIDISLEKLKDFDRYDNHRGKSTYFHLEIPHQSVEVQTHIQDNDATGIGWIYPECLKKMVLEKKLAISQHCRLVIRHFLNIEIIREIPMFNLLLDPENIEPLYEGKKCEDIFSWNRELSSGDNSTSNSLSCSPISPK